MCYTKLASYTGRSPTPVYVLPCDVVIVISNLYVTSLIPLATRCDAVELTITVLPTRIVDGLGSTPFITITEQVAVEIVSDGDNT